MRQFIAMRTRLLLLMMLRMCVWKVPTAIVVRVRRMFADVIVAAVASGGHILLLLLLLLLSRGEGRVGGVAVHGVGGVGGVGVVAGSRCCRGGGCSGTIAVTPAERQQHTSYTSSLVQLCFKKRSFSEVIHVKISAVNEL